MDWRRSRFPADGSAISANNQHSVLFQDRQTRVDASLTSLLQRLDGENPKFTPRFLGHMTSDVALPALLGHLAVLLHNPNQTSREVSVVSSGIEKEAIAGLLEMVGFCKQEGRGHFTGGGTLANFEALWRALHRLDCTTALGLYLVENKKMSREQFLRSKSRSWSWFESHAASLPPGALDSYNRLTIGYLSFAEIFERISGARYREPVVLAPASRHFSWPKAAALLGLGTAALREIPLDEYGRLSLEKLEEAFSSAREDGRAVGMVVSVSGATGTGTVDPIGKIQDAIEKIASISGEECWHHVDAAYGGYFCSLLKEPGSALSKDVENSLKAIARVNSITLDPHKLGFVPYSCGAFLARDAFHYRSPSFDAPYLLADNDGSWQHTIEGSRAGTGAAATWMANQTIGLSSEGYGRILQRSLLATQGLMLELSRAQKEISLIGPPDLNILCFFLARSADSLSECNRRTLECFRHFQKSPSFSISKTELKLNVHAMQCFQALTPKAIEMDEEKVVCLRVVLMNPFFTSQELNVSYVEEFMTELISVIGRIA